MHTLSAYPWPGNVRELQNVVERALLLAEGAVIGPSDLPGDVLRIPRAGEMNEPDLLPGQSLADARDAFERRLVTRVLGECRGNVSRAAERLGLDRKTLYRKLEEYAKQGAPDAADDGSGGTSNG